MHNRDSSQDLNKLQTMPLTDVSFSLFLPKKSLLSLFIYSLNKPGLFFRVSYIPDFSDCIPTVVFNKFLRSL